MSRGLYLIYVMTGGAIGALLRYGVYEALHSFQFSHSFQPAFWGLSHFPWATFFINIIGSFLFGLLAAVIPQLPFGESLRALFLTGVLGAFTTFSTFSFELFSLMAQSEFKVALLYSALSVILGVIGVWAGYSLMRAFW